MGAVSGFEAETVIELLCAGMLVGTLTVWEGVTGRILTEFGGTVNEFPCKDRVNGLLGGKTWDGEVIVEVFSCRRLLSVFKFIRERLSIVTLVSESFISESVGTAWSLEGNSTMESPSIGSSSEG